jgi:Family of unknown function (DUF6515)
MNKKVFFLALFVATAALFSDTPEASARGRYGGGVSYARPAAYHPATVARTRPVPAYRPAYRPAYGAGYGPASAAGVVRRTTRRQIGYSTAYLPTGYSSVLVGPSTYYTCDGDYYTYDQSSQQYTVVAPPLGATVTQLPPGATLVAGTTSVYVLNGVYYRPSYDNGVVVYTVSNP